MPSFNILDSYQDPKPDPRQVHRGLELPVISFHSSDDLTFEIIEGDTQRSNKLLVDSNGYSYTMKSHKHSRSGRITWRCTLRRKNPTCTATVRQVEDVFTPGSNTYIHPAESGLDIKVKITKKVHEYSKQNIFRTASTIVENVMSSDNHLDTPSISRPIPANLIRSYNYEHHRNRPTEPQNISFILDYNWIPQELLQADIKIAGLAILFLPP